MPDSNPESKIAIQEEPRELWPEEAEDASSRSKARSYFRQHPRAKWVLLALALVILVGGIVTWRYFAVRETTDDAQVDGYITPISARVGGPVTQVLVKDNDFVKKGQVLVQIDPTDYQVALERARAELADAQAHAQAARTSVPIASTSTASALATAHANLNAAQREVEMARARLREAQANYQRVHKDLERMQQLVQKEEVSRQQYDAAVAADEAARATVDAATAAVATAESHVVQAQAAVRAAQTAPQQVAVTQAQAGSATAAVQKAAANVQAAELNLSYTTVRAPTNGIIGRRNVDVGQVVQPGQPLFALIDLDDLWVTANFKETQLKNMRVGQRATIHVDAYDRDFRGHVDSMGGATGARFSLLPPENATGNYVKVVQRVPVKIVFEPNQDIVQFLRPGMSVVVTVLTK